MMKKRFQKLLCLALSAVMVTGMSITAFSAETQTDTDLQTAYENIMSYAEEHDIDLNMTYDDFLSSYNGQSAQSYEQSYYPVFVSPNTANTRSSGSTGSGNTYYYNTGYWVM